jgi:phage baseplate assembly protein V
VTQRQIQHAIGFGGVSAVADDSGPVQMVQVKVNDMQTIDGVPVVYFFGFSSSPPIGTDVVRVAAQGDPTLSVVIAHNDQSLRPTNVQPGGTIVYDASNRSLFFVPGGPIQINANGMPVEVNNASTVTINASAGVTINGDVQINGKLNTTGDVVAGTVSLQNHGNTGVQPGNGVSGPPKQ